MISRWMVVAGDLVRVGQHLMHIMMRKTMAVVMAAAMIML